MRDRLLIVAWILLLLALAAAFFYAEYSFEGGPGAGVAQSGDAATGAKIEADPNATGAAEGTAIVGAPPQGQGPAGAATDVVKAPEAAEPPPKPEPAPPPRVSPPARVAYASAEPADDGRPRIVVIMSEIGLSSARSRQAIERLPPAVTMAVMAYADERAEWIEASRAAGHESLLAIPMEPDDYPRIDPGPEPLLIDRDDLENLARFDNALSGIAGIVGVLAHRGSRFLEEQDRLRPILAATQDRGLIFVDSRSTPASAVAELAGELELYVLLNDRFIDEIPSRDQIDRRLAELEDIARRDGAAVGVASPRPVTIERIRAWAEELGERGFVLAPAASVAALGGP